MQRCAQQLKWFAPLAAIIVFAALYLFPPAQYPFYPRCMFLSLTGYQCPGCGSLRSLHHLAHGELLAAFWLNPFLYTVVPALLLCRKQLHRPGWLWSFVGAVVIFTVVRNVWH